MCLGFLRCLVFMTCSIRVQVTALHRESDGNWSLDVTDKAAESSQRMGGFSGIVLADYLAAKAGAVNEPQADKCCSMGLNATKASAACPTHLCSEARCGWSAILSTRGLAFRNSIGFCQMKQAMHLGQALHQLWHLHSMSVAAAVLHVWNKLTASVPFMHQGQQTLAENAFSDTPDLGWQFHGSSFVHCK